MEIERKFLVKRLPAAIDRFASVRMEQGYISTDPVVRIRRENDAYVLTIKGNGFLKRTEVNLPISEKDYTELSSLIKGIRIEKTRYYIDTEDIVHWDDEEPVRTVTHDEVGGGRVIELDVFSGECEGLVIAEIEFADAGQARAYEMAEVFSEDVSFEPRYHNSYISEYGYEKN